LGLPGPEIQVIWMSFIEIQLPEIVETRTGVVLNRDSANMMAVEIQVIWMIVRNREYVRRGMILRRSLL
jgi:hypothetical protein